MGDLYGDYDRRDYLSQSQTPFVLLVIINGQRYIKPTKCSRNCYDNGMHTYTTLEATVAFSVVRQSRNMWSNWVILKTISNALFEVITSYNDTIYNHYITFFTCIYLFHIILK